MVSRLPHSACPFSSCYHKHIDADQAERQTEAKIMLDGIVDDDHDDDDEDDEDDGDDDNDDDDDDDDVDVMMMMMMMMMTTTINKKKKVIQTFEFCNLFDLVDDDLEPYMAIPANKGFGLEPQTEILVWLWIMIFILGSYSSCSPLPTAGLCTGSPLAFVS
ncbi:hypothetical protein PoB_007215200 [Plakobranchus ocellatus]|uniref:Uncharacterized protein n=1 Tax=Plakobranchus ocellatus TaxID=259542 RepID=A0AAV4DMV9_9GAST|nr:hypothetical protein PoB_007215200 [Plakobranchus ocellatus]